MENPTEDTRKPLIIRNDNENSNNFKLEKLSKKSPLICLECRTQVASHSGLRWHVQTRHSEKQSQLLGKQCNECDIQFQQRRLYHRHYLAKHDQRRDEQVVAQFDYKPRKPIRRFDKYKKPLLDKLSKASPLICLECRAKIASNGKFLVHVKKRHLEKSEWLLGKDWIECKLTFQQRRLYQKHYLDEHDMRSDQQVLDELNQKTGTVEKQTRRRKNKIWNECDNFDFLTRQNYRDHRNSYHSQNILMCTLCDYATTNPRSGRAHIRIKHIKEYFDYRFAKTEASQDPLQKLDINMLDVSITAKYENKEN